MARHYRSAFAFIDALQQYMKSFEQDRPVLLFKWIHNNITTYHTGKIRDILVQDGKLISVLLNTNDNSETIIAPIDNDNDTLLFLNLNALIS